MLDAVLELLPTARVGHIGLQRDESTAIASQYYSKLPNDVAERDVFLLDPMLATGGSAAAAIQLLKDEGAKRVRLLCIIGAPEGIEVVETAHPDVDIILAAQDERLDEHGYIIPGLGDAGDRLYGTR